MPSAPDPRQDWDLARWLSHAEALHSQAIALGLDRVGEVARRLGLRFDCPVITVAGTNGKGSTCAFIESVLAAAGYRVGVYSSPHLIDFEERCRIGGEPVAAADLAARMFEVERAREAEPAVALTYFEFTTLAILRLMQHAGLDAAVLEVGMGGRLDAVNVIDADCAVITSVDLDHMEFLGPDREAIGREKAGIMRPGRVAVISDPRPPASVLEHACAIGAEARRIGHEFGYTAVGQQQWNWHGVAVRRPGLAYPTMRGANQLLNASGALAALEALHDRLPTSAGDVRAGLARAELPGRFQVLPGQPAIVLDVAHNPHAAAVLAQNLDAMGYAPTLGVFGAMADKDVAGVFRQLQPVIARWHLCDLPLPRAARAADLAEVLRGVDPAAEVHCHAGPEAAFAAASAEAAPTDRIVVFGSFHTVGGVLAARRGQGR